MIHAKQLNKEYKKGSQSVFALKSIQLEIEKGEQVAVIGRSGSGKSTLLNILAGLDRPSSGEILVDGEPLHQLSEKAMARYRLKTVGIVFQSFQLIAQRNVHQNIELPLLLSGIPAKERKLRTQQAMEQVSMGHRANHFPYELSGGEQQRVAIARAIISQPKILLADEPTGNLDPHHRQEIQDLLIHLCRENDRTFVLVTHNYPLAESLCKRTIELKDGQIKDENDLVTKGGLL